MSISISKHVFAKLSASEALKTLVGDKIFPLSTKEATTFPFIIYKRDSLTPAYTKDRYDTGDNVVSEVVVASDNYFNSIEIAEVVRESLENKRGKYKSFNVTDAKLLSADEDFIDDTFIQRLTFSFNTETE